MRKAKVDETQAGIKIPGRNINNLRYADDIILMAGSEEKLKGFLVGKEIEKLAEQQNIHKTKIMASSPIPLWQINGETMETVRDFNFLALKSLQIVTAAMKLRDNCSLEGKL